MQLGRVHLTHYQTHQGGCKCDSRLKLVLAGLEYKWAKLAYMLLYSLTDMHARQHMYSHIHQTGQHHFQVLALSTEHSPNTTLSTDHT